MLITENIKHIKKQICEVDWSITLFMFITMFVFILVYLICWIILLTYSKISFILYSFPNYSPFCCPNDSIIHIYLILIYSTPTVHVSALLNPKHYLFKYIDFEPMDLILLSFVKKIRLFCNKALSFHMIMTQVEKLNR